MYQSKDSQTLGDDIRALRKARGFTLADLAERLGRSVGWLSQVERDMSEPGVEDLRDLARVLDVSVSSLFASGPAKAEEAGHIVRAGSRRPIGSRQDGLVEELLSPDLTDDFEMVYSTFEAGAKLTWEQTRPTQEVGFIISGKLKLWISGRLFEVGQGDSFRIRGEAYKWENPYDKPCQAIWVIAPPVY